MPDASQPRRKLNVDMEELAAALDDTSGGVNYYLDLETGEAIPVTEEARLILNDIYERLEGETREVEGEFGRKFDEVLAGLALPDWLTQAVIEADRVESGFGVRYVSVLAADSREGYRDMEDFINIVADARLAELLSVAINGRDAFPRFRDVLARLPEERKRWFQFQNARLRQRALEWLEDMDIEWG